MLRCKFANTISSQYLEDNSPWCSTFPTWAREIHRSQVFFKDVYIANSLGRIESPSRAEADLFPDQNNKDNVCLWGKGWPGLPAAPGKAWGFLSLRFLGCDIIDPSCAQPLPGPPPHCPMGLRSKGNLCEHQAHVAHCARVVKSSVIQAPLSSAIICEPEQTRLANLQAERNLGHFHTYFKGRVGEIHIKDQVSC